MAGRSATAAACRARSSIIEPAETGHRPQSDGNLFRPWRTVGFGYQSPWCLRISPPPPPFPRKRKGLHFQSSGASREETLGFRSGHPARGNGAGLAGTASNSVGPRSRVVPSRSDKPVARDKSRDDNRGTCTFANRRRPANRTIAPVNRFRVADDSVDRSKCGGPSPSRYIQTRTKKEYCRLPPSANAFILRIDRYTAEYRPEWRHSPTGGSQYRSMEPRKRNQSRRFPSFLWPTSSRYRALVAANAVLKAGLHGQ